MGLIEVRIPQQGLTVDSVTITGWLKSEGDYVRQGEPLFEMMSEKANLEVESPATGKLARILADHDTEASIGEVVAYIET